MVSRDRRRADCQSFDCSCDVCPSMDMQYIRTCDLICPGHSITYLMLSVTLYTLKFGVRPLKRPGHTFVECTGSSRLLMRVASPLLGGVSDFRACRPELSLALGSPSASLHVTYTSKWMFHAEAFLPVCIAYFPSREVRRSTLFKLKHPGTSQGSIALSKSVLSNFHQLDKTWRCML